MVAFGDEADYYRDIEIKRIEREARRAQLRDIESLGPWLSEDELELLRDVANTPTTTPPTPTTSIGDWIVGSMLIVMAIMSLGTFLASR